jgi:hypothetical protein
MYSEKRRAANESKITSGGKYVRQGKVVLPSNGAAAFDIDRN